MAVEAGVLVGMEGGTGESVTMVVHVDAVFVFVGIIVIVVLDALGMKVSVVEGMNELDGVTKMVDTEGVTGVAVGDCVTTLVVAV